MRAPNGGGYLNSHHMQRATADFCSAALVTQGIDHKPAGEFRIEVRALLGHQVAGGADALRQAVDQLQDSSYRFAAAMYGEEKPAS